MEITNVNANTPEGIWLKKPADVNQRCETATLIRAGTAGVPATLVDMAQELFVDVIPCGSDVNCNIGTTIQYMR